MGGPEIESRTNQSSVYQDNSVAELGNERVATSADRDRRRQQEESAALRLQLSMLDPESALAIVNSVSGKLNGADFAQISRALTQANLTFESTARHADLEQTSRTGTGRAKDSATLGNRAGLVLTSLTRDQEAAIDRLADSVAELKEVETQGEADKATSEVNHALARARELDRQVREELELEQAREASEESKAKELAEQIRKIAEEMLRQHPQELASVLFEASEGMSDEGRAEIQHEVQRYDRSTQVLMDRFLPVSQQSAPVRLAA